MATKRETILSAIYVKLQTITGAQTIARSRPLAFKREESPAVNLVFSSDVAESNNPVGFINWKMLFRIEVITRGDLPDVQADPIVASINSKLMSDQSLGGLTMDIQPASANFELLDGDKPIGVIVLSYQVSYRTSSTNLAT